MNNRMSMYKGHRADDVLSHSSSHSSDTSDIIYSQLSPIHSSKRAVTAKNITSSSVPLNVCLTNNKIDVFASRTQNKNIDRSDRLEHSNDNIIDNALNVKNVNTKVNVAKIMEVPESQPKHKQKQQQQQQQHLPTQHNSVISVSLKSINVAMTMNTESFFSSSTSSAASSSSSSSSSDESSLSSKASSSLSSSTTSSDEWGGFEQSFKVALHNNEVDLSTLNNSIKINNKENIKSKRTISAINNNNDDEDDDDDKREKDKINNSEPHTNRKDVELVEESEEVHQVRSKDHKEKSDIYHVNELKNEDKGSDNAEIEEESDGLFIPDTVFQLSCAIEKPQIPYLSELQLTIGSTVWVVDEEDVETIMEIYWQPIHKRVCNGKMKGTVQRHSGNMTLVKFSGTNETDTFVLTLPRICLSLKEIAPYESICQSEMRGIMTACYSNLSPRATRGRATSSNDVSIAHNVYRDTINNDEISKEDICGAHKENNCTCNLSSTLEGNNIEESCNNDNTGRSEIEWNDMNTKTMNDKIKINNYHNVNTDKTNWVRRNKLNEPLQRIDRIACCYYETVLEHDTSEDIHNISEYNESMTENICNSWEEVYKVVEQKFFKGLFAEALEAFKPIEHEFTSIDSFISSRVELQEKEEEQKEQCHEYGEVKKYHCEEREEEESDSKLYMHEECSCPLQREEKTKSAKYSDLMKTVPSELILKILLLRSRIFLFLETYDSALIDAQRCVRLSQRNPFVYLHLARAHSAVADFESAKLSIATAKLLASSKLINVLAEVNELNSYMLAIQSFMKQQGSHLTVYLDPYYRKRLCPVHSFSANETMYCHDRPIISLSSFFSEPPANTCNFCYEPVEIDSRANIFQNNTYHPHQAENVAGKKIVNEQEEEKEKCHTEETRDKESIAQLAENIIALNTNETSKTTDFISRSDVDDDDDDDDETCNNNSNVDIKEIIQISSTCDMKKKASGNLFCSSECANRGTRLFELMQVHKDGITRARELIYSKAAVTIDRYPLEMGAMTIRMFFYVIAENTLVMKEQCISFEEQETTLKETLKHLNVYPMVTEIISSRLRDEIGAVYDALTVNFTPKHKALYSIELFTYLYRYVRAYFVSVQIEQFSVNNKYNTSNFNTNKDDENDNIFCSGENQSTSNKVINNTTSADNEDNNDNNDNIDEERKLTSEEKPAEMSDITHAASTSSTDKKNRLDLVFPLFANDNTNRHNKLTLFCLPTIIGGVDKASVTSCFGSGHVEIRHLAAIASLSKSQLGASKSLNITADNNSSGINKRDRNMGRSYNSSSGMNNRSSSSGYNVNETICFASAPPNCEIHAKFTTFANMKELPSVMHNALICKHLRREVTPEKFAEHTTSAFAIAEECVEENKENVTTEENNIKYTNNDCTLNIVSIASQNEIKAKQSSHNHTEDVKVHSSENEQLGVVDDSKFTFVESYNKLHMQLVATRSINKNDKLLLPPFVLDFSEL